MTLARWNQSDLLRRVARSLDVASETIRVVAGDDRCEPATEASLSALLEKVVAETAMLLLCVAPIRDQDDSLYRRFEQLVDLLIPVARGESVLAAICLDPGTARDHGAAHIMLSHLGYPDPEVDTLLSQSLALGPHFGPERLPHRLLEQTWLERLWPANPRRPRADARLLAISTLGRPIDALGSARFDLYAFTHAVMYASDLGSRRPALPRPIAAIVADADAALAYSVDIDDFDLSAEIALTWPMLDLAWSPAGACAFQILATTDDECGFLPGSHFDPTHYETLSGDAQGRYRLVTSYHTDCVMGFLCAAMLRRGHAPPVVAPREQDSRGAGQAVLRMIDAQGIESRFRTAVEALAPRQQDAVASLMLGITLRRARARGDLTSIREALEVALRHHLDAPATRQAAALLRRSVALGVAITSSASPSLNAV